MHMPTANFLLSIFALSLLMVSCKNGNSYDGEDESVLQELDTELPVASSASRSPCSACNRVFLTIGKESYHLEGHPMMTETTTLEETLKLEHQKTEARELPLLYLIAPPDLPFSKISNSVRAAAKAGFADIYFVAKRKETSGNYLMHGLMLQLPLANGSPTSAIEPILIKADAKGQIFINTGPSQELLDEGLHLHHFPQLERSLDNYCAAARAGGQAPHAQVYIEPHAPHQRAIDILNTLHATHFRHITFTTVSSNPQRTCQGMGKGTPGKATTSPSAIPKSPPVINPIKD